MKDKAQLTKILLFIRTASTSSQCPIPFKESSKRNLGKALLYAPKPLLRGLKHSPGML
jgi:hypothetical protein